MEKVDCKIVTEIKLIHMLNYIEIEASEQQAKHSTPSLASVVGFFFTELFGPYFKLADSLIKSSQAGNY